MPHCGTCVKFLSSVDFQHGPQCSIIIENTAGLLMNSNEFSRVRRALGKTQSELARLLCVSVKAIQSFEQGWRKVPVSNERQLLFILALKTSSNGDSRLCWEIRNCPPERRGRCPTWEFKAGKFCWFINGTLCHGETQRSWGHKIELCRQCEVFQVIFPSIIAGNTE